MHYDVTIGIPVYQTENYIGRTMESALSQTYPSIEFLIIDDASEDQSPHIVEQFQREHPRGKDIRLIRHKDNQGVSATRNQIIAEASGDYLYFMDSDDTIVPTAIARLMDAVKSHHAEIAFGSYEKIELNGNRTVYQYPELAFSTEGDFACFAYRRYAGIQASACNFLVSLTLLRSSGLQFMPSRFWEDTIFTLELVTFISRAVLLPDITYTYRCRPHSLSDISNEEVIGKEEILRYFATVEQLKRRKAELRQKPYYPNRCYVAVMSDFYIICNILKRKDKIRPAFTDRELCSSLRHPASLAEILRFRQMKLQNLMLYTLGKLPAPLCIRLIRLTGKRKGLI